MANASGTQYCEVTQFKPNQGIYCLIQGHRHYAYKADTKKVYLQVGEQWKQLNERELMECTLVVTVLTDRYNQHQQAYQNKQEAQARPAYRSYPSKRQRFATRLAHERANSF